MSIFSRTGLGFMLTLGTVAAIGAAPLAANTTAPSIFTYATSGPNAPGTSGYGSKITNWSATFDRSQPGQQLLTLDVTMGTEFVRDDGFWMVLNAGGNPKGVTNELAILYGDLANNRVTAYQYNGANSNNSYQATPYLATFNNAFSFTGNSRFSFALDMQRINSLPIGANWKGAQFNEQIGIWYHPFSVISVRYDGNRLASFGAAQGAQSGWFDTAARQTTPRCPGNTAPVNGRCGPTTNVSEPGTLALLGAGLVGIGALRRRRAA